MTAKSTKIFIGRITGAHGIRGEVTIRSETELPQNIGAYGVLTDGRGDRRFEVKVVRTTPKGAVIARIAGIADRTAAEQLAGTDLYVERCQLPAPDEGEFYHSDLIGLKALAPDGTAIGDVVAIQNYGAGDLIELRPHGETMTELVPFSDAYVPFVDIAAGTITIILPLLTGDEDEDSGLDRN